MSMSPATTLLLHVVVRYVVVEMAVQKPLAGLASCPDHVIALARRDIEGVLPVPGGLRNRDTVRCDDGERPAADVHRVYEGAARVDEANEQPLADAERHDLGLRVCLPVDRRS
jgi:hypothetical protein